MWTSSDDSDTKQKTVSHKQGNKPPTCASKTNPPKHGKTAVTHESSFIPQYKFCANSSDSSDTDSSDTCDVKTDRSCIGAQAAATDKAALRGKQLVSEEGRFTYTKGQPASTKGQPASTKGQSSSTKGQPASTKGQPASTKERQSYVPSKTQPDVRPKTYSGIKTMPARGSVEVAPAGSPRKGLVIQDYSMEYPTLGASVFSSKENEKQLHGGNASQVTTSLKPGKTKLFEKCDRSDRGQQYSKREEKFNLTDFLPEALSGKTQKKKRQQSKPEVFHAESISDRVQGAAAAARNKSQKMEAASYASGPLWHKEKKTKGIGGKKNRPGAPQERGSNDSSATEDSEDEDLSMLLLSQPHFIPPFRQANRDAEQSKNNVSMVGVGVDGSGTRPRHMGGTRHGNDADMGVFEIGEENNRRENPRNRGDNPHNRRARNDNVRERPEGRNRAQPVPPPPENGREEEEQRNADRPHQGRGGGHRQRNIPQPEGLRHLEANLSFTRLQELKIKQPAEVVAALSYSKEGLFKLLNNEQKLTGNAPMMKLLLSCLAKTCRCNSMPTQKSEILNLVRASPFFLRLLGTFLSTISVSGKTEELTDIFGETADLLKTLVTLFPSCLHDIVMAHAFLEMAQKQVLARGGGELPEDVAKKIDDLDTAQDAAMDGMQQKEAKKRGVVDEDSLTPPDDFRQISVFPTMEDLNKDELPFLRKNKRKGGYTGMDHYLDVQFRLMREDFVYPLREGIAEYLAILAGPKRGRKLKDIRVYHNVHILRAVCLPSTLGHRLTFDVSNMKRVRWAVTKRLIYGSLVCLSADNFQTLYFATVSNRDASDLREGVVDVTFEHNLEEITAIPSETTFTMAETTAFFEAYRHVLSGLQRMQGNQLPFQKYIVKCDKTIDEPRYLMNDDTAAVEYDLRPLVDDTVMLKEERKRGQLALELTYEFSTESQPAEKVPVLHRENWPDHELLRLDKSQFDALYNALTKEFSITQGPPGTGKTYVGQKIVKTLLHNRKCWDPNFDSCILIVCYTNHALDQFLEGIVSYFEGNVVRVGSRLRSEKLEQYSLTSLRWRMRRHREDMDTDFRAITRLRFQGLEAMDGLKREIDTMGLKIESAKREILHEEVLMPYMLDRHYDRLVDARDILSRNSFSRQGGTKKKVYCIPEWLGILSTVQNTEMMAEQLEMLDHELGEDEELEIEGEVQAQEEQNRLDTDNKGGNDREKREREKKRALAQERHSYLAVDVSKLDYKNEKQQGGGGDDGFQITRAQWKKLKRKLRRNVELEDRMTAAEERQVADLWMLDIAQRWRLYRRWTHSLCEALKLKMGEREQRYDDLARRHQETLMQEDKHILKFATVLAMTTTAAARYQSVLQEVKPKIIVVEEAAEVLEGHVITTLSQDCEHLILIGDHKQLRPSPTVYALARKYNLELSLFERMINNGLKCTTLGWQHRMRPEIATLMKPIYPDLNDHPSVNLYEAIKGVSTNLFFINHAEPETHDDETKSHSNLYEAEYMARLCLYLLKQGYDPSRITVLTTYSGQLFHLRKLMPKKSIFDGVRVTVVDNFQGEENDIILLSLVRSNDDSNIGFLKTENRVCVALSRARMGLYVIGNFDLLSAESELWQTITADLRRSGNMGESLHLYCQNHPRNDGLLITQPADFMWTPEGGCMMRCSARLNCGHVCEMTCHPCDQEHVEYKCAKPCGRKMNCEFGHVCKKHCYEDCGECKERVQRMITKCGHMQWMNCCEDPKEFICQETCHKMMSCGHKCGDVCGERHKCMERIQHTWPCGHTAEVWCSLKSTTPCKHPCGQTLVCGHLCAGTCDECDGGRLHKQCLYACSRILVCGHSCRDACSNCPPCRHKCENSCVHSSCQKSCGLPCVPCKEPCAWQCPHYRCHELCGDPCDRPACNEPCPFELRCGHPCVGLCGEPCPELCRVCNADELTTIFFGNEDHPDARFVQLEDCQHILEVSGLDQWMTTTTDTDKDSIHLKSCPFCKTPIRRNLRYGAIIKTQLNDIETVKNKMLGDKEKRLDTQAEVELLIEDETDVTYEDMKKDIKRNGDDDSLGGLVAMVNQMKFLQVTKKLHMVRRKREVAHQPFQAALRKFETWLCKRRSVFSDQDSQDAVTESLRLRHWLCLLVYTGMVKTKQLGLPSTLLQQTTDMLKRMKDGLPYGKSDQDNGSGVLESLKELVPDTTLGISETERIMILKAMALNQGHWFKCPKGHVYAITDCGGATMESTCPDCNATIGGTQHRLRTDNALATEMDGATRSAWPPTLDNYSDSDNDSDTPDFFDFCMNNL